MLNEFKAFIARGNVMDLAVGVIIGAAFNKIVESVVNDLVMPVVGALTGGGFDFSNYFIAIAINGLLDGLWLEGCLAGELFEESELVGIALTSIETLLGLSLRQAGTAR